jgi:CBS domain-containing protein
LTVNALNFKPPLGFFRRFVLEEHGGQEDTLDLKHNGLVPIIDLARIHALSNGIGAVNTLERLQQLSDGGGMASSDAADLRDAYEFIAGVRLRHQADRIRDGKEPDNYVSPDALSPFERRHLKDAFKVVSRMQSALEQRYQTGLISR